MNVLKLIAFSRRCWSLFLGRRGDCLVFLSCELTAAIQFRQESLLRRSASVSEGRFVGGVVVDSGVGCDLFAVQGKLHDVL